MKASELIRKVANKEEFTLTIPEGLEGACIVFQEGTEPRRMHDVCIQLTDRTHMNMDVFILPNMEAMVDLLSINESLWDEIARLDEECAELRIKAEAVNENMEDADGKEEEKASGEGNYPIEQAGPEMEEVLDKEAEALDRSIGVSEDGDKPADEGVELRGHTDLSGNIKDREEDERDR